MSEILSIRIMKRADEGLGGVWLPLPSTEEQLKAVLNEIGMKEAAQRDILISDYRTSLSILDNTSFVSNTDLNELNYLAARLADLDPADLETLEAVGESPYHLNSIAKMIDFTYNTDYYVLTTGVHDAEDLGRHCLYNSGQIQMPEEWKSAVDPEALGKRIAEVENGAFTSHGYLNLSGDEWKEQYRAGDIPARYRIFNYLAAAEMSVEGNYNQIDGVINNEGPRRADLTDGQTHDEIEELAPETLRDKDKPSILEQLKEAKGDAAQPGQAREKKPHDLDL